MAPKQPEDETSIVSPSSDFQFSPRETVLRCLFLVAAHHGVQLAPESLASIAEPDGFQAILRVMHGAGLKGRVLRNAKWKHLSTLGSAFPVLAMQKNGNWVIVLSVVTTPDGVGAAAVLNPLHEQAGMVLVPRDQFVENWSGVLILCRKQAYATAHAEPFGLRWFLPEIMRHRAYFRDVAVAAVMCSIFGFTIPLLFQIIVDKVITHRSYNTLFVVIMVFTVATLFEGVFSYVRQYLMLFTTNKIDARLNSSTFQHLLSLPLQFFESNSAGVLTRHMQQTEGVRQFLTGRLFQTLLDVGTMPLLLGVLCLYSFKLTAVVILFSLAITGVIGLIMPVFRRLLEQLYTAEGARQALLVESLHGMATIKSLALEPLRKSMWENRVAASVRRWLSVGRVAAFANVLTHGLEKVMQFSVLGLGVVDVFDGTLSVGALIAFNMLSGRVSGPLVQIVSVINEYQQTALAVKMLGTVMRHPPERDPDQHGIRPRISGALEFDNVTFRYQGSATPAVDRVSFRVEEGQMIGVVGRSGSGKSTVTRLIQAIHTAQEGVVRLSGADIRHIDLPHLRSSIGVVLQENFLFRGTIRDNIAAAKPDSSLDQIMEAARMAGADEFIDRLPKSYGTEVEENGANFSGGQRQRIAIARALLSHPRLLIFDEATSALDPESEAIVQQNLGTIARGRTMIVVSHRLSSLVQADSILVLEQGQVVDFAPHKTLIGRCDVYQHLWQQQTQYLQ